MYIRPLLALPLLAACVQEPPFSNVESGPEAPEAGACYAQGIVPAQFETVTTEETVVPAMVAPDGTVLREAETRIASDTVETAPREESWFKAPCPLMGMNPAFIEQVQRALAARDLYTGPITGEYDAETRAAVRAYQADTGPESDFLSLENAKRLGLIALGRDGV